MSVVTSLIIIIPQSEDEQSRLEELNQFEVNDRKFIFQTLDQIIEANDGLLFHTGSKSFNSIVILASYNDFPIDEFLKHVSQKVKWDNAEYVQVLVNSEKTNDRTFRVYSNAGGKLLLDSEKW